MDRRSNWLGLAMLVIAAISLWGAWIPAKAVALRVNAFDFAEWSTVLMQVRSGELRLFPEIIRIAIVLCGIALALKAGDIRNLWVRWLIRAAALLPAILVVPQFPFWLQDAHRVRFGIAVIGLIGVGLSALADRNERIRSWLIIGTAISAAVLAIWGYAVLSVPFAARYGGSMVIGWGLIAFVGMLVGAAVIEGMRMMRQTRQVSIAAT
jgi:hypothetical protein